MSMSACCTIQLYRFTCQVMEALAGWMQRTLGGLVLISLIFACKSKIYSSKCLQSGLKLPPTGFSRNTPGVKHVPSTRLRSSYITWVKQCGAQFDERVSCQAVISVCVITELHSCKLCTPKYMSDWATTMVSNRHSQALVCMCFFVCR